MAFRTKLDFSDNRQAKQRIETIQNLSGATTFGAPFSSIPTGPNLTTSGISQTTFNIVSTFSGNSGTTIYNWFDPRMLLGESALSALTPSNSGITQNTGNIFIAGGSNILGAASSFVLLAGTSITNGLAFPRLVNGNTGHISTLTNPFTYNGGSDVAGNGPLNGGVNPSIFTIGTPLGDAHAALETLSALIPTFSYASGVIDLATDITTPSGIGVFTAGTYNISGATNIGTAGITLSGSGRYVFQINGALTSVANSNVMLSGGATSDNVYWVPVGGASLGSTTSFVGNVLAGPAAITTGLNAIINGRLISESAITIGGGTPMISIPIYSGGSTTIIDGNTIVLNYQGISFDIIVSSMIDLGGGNFSGSVNTSIFNILSATSIDFTGRTIWVDVSGQTRTNELIITKNPVIGNVFTCIDSEGKGAWLPSSGDTSGGTNITVTGGTYNNSNGTATFTNNTGSTFTITGFTTGSTIYWSASTHANAIVVNFSNSVASNNNALAEGSNTLASGIASHAEGSGTTASGRTSHAEGTLTIASGNFSHSEGLSTTANGLGGHTEGGYTIASGVGSHAEGAYTTASGLYSHAEGSYCSSITTPTLASGRQSHAEGEGTTASGLSSHAEGSVTTAWGPQSHAEGHLTIASGTSSHAEGYLTTASGDYSHAEGGLTTTSGVLSHAEGLSTIANGDYSHVGGTNTIASGLTSFVHGTNSIAGGANTIVFGANITGTTSDTTYVDRLNIKTVGSSAFVNDIRIDANGNLTTNTSDVRLKENINSISGALDKIKSLRGVTYNWKDRSAGGNSLRLGFIAQEVAEVEPLLVFTNKNDDYKGLHIDGIIPLIVEAIKELSSGITTTNNTHLETETILAEDNNIDLNYSGTPTTAIGGGITVLHAMGQDIGAQIITDSDGNWITNNDFKSKALTIPTYTPTSSDDENGSDGNITKDANYLYIKDNGVWKRTNLE